MGTDSSGGFVGYVVGAPTVVNEPFFARFPGGTLPANTPLILVTRAGSALPARSASPSASAAGRTRYDGPLFDAHLHVGTFIGQGNGSLASLLDRDGIDWALGFYGTGGVPASVRRMGQIAADARGRVIPLIQPVNAREGQAYLSDHPSNGDVSGLFQTYLRPAGQFAGVGEVALYFPSMYGLNFTSPDIQALFAASDSRGGIMMVHPRSSQFPNPTTSVEVANILDRYSAAMVLLHGGPPIYNLVEPLMQRHTNLFFSYDFPGWAGVPFGSSIDGGGSTVDFLSGLQRAGGIDAVAERGARLIGEHVARHPDRVMWGTDRFLPWHWDVEVGARIVEISRLLIARLPADVQEPYAYRNAERVLGPHLSA